MTMDLGSGIAFGSLILGFLGFVWKVSKDEEGKRSKIHERINTVKDEFKKEFVQRDICEVVHKNVDITLKKIEEKVDCIPEIKASIDLLLQQNCKEK